MPEQPKKKPSGAQYRKRRKERQQAEREARIALARAQGKLNDAEAAEDVVWTPRPHQRQIEEAHQRGIRRQAHVWHRRAGKSAACLDFLARRAMERPGVYWYLCPKLTQTRTALWESRRKDGIREIDVHIPASIRTRTNENMMTIELVNGSIIKFLGSDGFDRLVGSNVHGIVLDEFALGDPAAWDYLSPILAADPESWALMISTYRGRNHWYRLVQRVKDDPAWHTSVLTVEDTVNEDGLRIITPEILEQERREGKDEGTLRQEYFCDPLAAFEGAYYAREMQTMKDEGRIGPAVYDPALPVISSWDLGYADDLVVVFWQVQNGEHVIIGSRSWNFTNLPDAFDDIRASFPWGKRPMIAVLPHDGSLGRLEGTPRSELFAQYLYEPEILPPSNVAAGIEAVRAFLGKVRIDDAPRDWAPDGNNARLIESLLGYRTKRATEGDVYQRTPAHTWESHAADAVRYYVTWRASGGGESPLTGWGPAPNYANRDRAVI